MVRASASCNSFWFLSAFYFSQKVKEICQLKKWFFTCIFWKCIQIANNSNSLEKNFQNTCITNFYLQRMYALADFYSFIFSGVPSICVSHIYRTLNKRKSPCDMIATNEHIAACLSHWIVINNNERPIIATCSSRWIVIDNLWI